MRALLVAALLLGGWGQMAGAEDLVLPEKMNLWPDGAPGAKGEEPTDIPTLTHFPASPRKASGCAIVICPGGGYRHLANGHEGNDIAAWANSLNVTAFVLNYRLAPNYKHPAMMDDVQRAIQHVRANADKYSVDPERVGVLGFSAGGHLASTAATHILDADPDAEDPVRRVSSRPDFAVLCYPVITFVNEAMHRGSRNNLLGEDAPAELVEKMSNELQVSEKTPPTFLFHTFEDTGVPPLNSVLFYTAMLEHGVPGELHIFQSGRHGVGLGRGINGTEEWSNLVAKWMETNGWIGK
ncbi:alpha/beta hydrolase [Rubinisphaera brasiliensis]|uniref:Alpha/beta hydrolase n=1 Tax=Rubinisphaera brasiliensis (strain ATCC 49424 / DSM 5305 / JCM 21570 / IAM 15109 / NBRC 103401 / IFAM 1448) TaxID=756272 RepID=F0SJZ5_RUBBR|nr:alpha/beta hydrolase [Rubinisphaera brasiliensis]ADY58684.1 alpha/beta hydrolase [Rubinisphaera brasiliensis DSM 5305]